MIYRGNTFLLMPSEVQAEALEQHMGVCRLVWNLCLDQMTNWHRQYKENTGNSLNFVSQSRELTKLRKECDFVKECPQESAQFAIANLHDTFSNFFKGKCGYPKYKKKGKNDKISYKGRDLRFIKLNSKWSMVRIPKLGWIKFRQTKEMTGKVFECVVFKSVSNWRISFTCKIDRSLTDVGGLVGIDRGVAVPIALSDGQSFAMPASIDKVDRQQRKAQRVASRRKRGSNRHAKAQQRVRNLAAGKARIRKDWAHKATTAITAQYATIVIERLRTANMTKSVKGTVENPGKNVAQKRSINRAILNVGWFQIEQMLAYKAFKLIKINPAYTSQCCSACGAIDKRSRKSQADFQCVECGFEANADYNAAINILQRGNTALLDVEGCGYAPVEASTAVMATLTA